MAYKFYNNYANRKQPNNGVYTFLLYLSYVWVSLFSTSGILVTDFTMNFGRLFSFMSENLFYEVFYVLMYAGINTVLFLIILWFYRMFLATKVYTFVVPVERLKAECIIYFIIRNIFYGIFLNLCFLYPYIYNLDNLVNVTLTLIMTIVFAYKVQKEYSESIISHFVFKNFCYPVFWYQILIYILNLLGAL